MRFVARLAVVMGAFAGMGVAKQALFFDPSMPVHATPVNLGKGGILARGLLLHAGKNEWVVYDQDLLRPAYWFTADDSKEPLSLETMAQSSWYEATKKAKTIWPEPQGQGVALAPALPGVGDDPAALQTDPRPVFTDDAGRGGLQASGRNFTGYRIAATAAVLASENGGVAIREWYEAERSGGEGRLTRNLVVAPGAVQYFLVGAGEFQVNAGKDARSADGSLTVLSNHAGLKLESVGGQLLARLEASKSERRVSLVYSTGKGMARTKPTPAVPAVRAAQWNRTTETRIDDAKQSGPGWALDRVALPLQNPWDRRVRPADLAFLPGDKAAVVTFEGDVWLVGLGGNRCQWRRIAGGLCEPMAIARIGDALQVFTRNGIVRLRDENGDGEIDSYENFCSLMVQSASARGYPLDMKAGKDGETWCAIGGIATTPKGGGGSGAPSVPHSGSIFKISADGRKLEIVGKRAREPFFDVDPVTGYIAMSDQQGNYIPSSGIFPVTEGSYFGYGDKKNTGLTPPVVWIPHEDDTSSASPMWVRKTAFPEWESGLLNLSYGTGRLFLVRPGEGWPADQGAVIPLGIETGLPLLHSQVNPADGSLWLAGFRIYDSRVSDLEGIGRLRRTKEPLAVPVDAKIVAEGVVLTYAGELDPATVTGNAARAKEWQYRRTPSYGSPRVKRDGQVGVDAVATGATVLSNDRKSVFVHIPDLKPTMQLEISCDFAVKGAAKSGPSTVYFTVTKPKAADWPALGFATPKLNADVAKVHEQAGGGQATAEAGKELATRFGCIACHSVDGATQGHSGPTWKGLYGMKREFKDGSTLAAVDEPYLKESILDPAKRIVKGFELGMGSYAGVIGDTDIDSLVLYIKSLK